MLKAVVQSAVWLMIVS